jgi:hypothetical protein
VRLISRDYRRDAEGAEDMTPNHQQNDSSAQTFHHRGHREHREHRDRGEGSISGDNRPARPPAKRQRHNFGLDTAR